MRFADSNRDSHRNEPETVPGRWRVSPLRHLIGQIQSGVSVNASDTPAALDEVAVLKTSSVYTGDFDVSQTKPVIEGDLHRVACPVSADRLIVSRMNTPALVGMAGYSANDVPNVFLPDRLWQVSFVGIEARFVHRWTQTSAYRDQVTVVTAGTSSSMHNLAQEDFKSFVLAIPPVDEQDAILRYLDRQTSKIDLLIEKQERLIETLLERRRAAISHAVTKGLDPNASYKTTGTRWMPTVPAHWGKLKLRWSCDFLNGDRGVNYPSREDMTESGVPFINAGHLRDGRVDFEAMNYIAPEKYAQMGGAKLASGDILYCLRGSLGKNALVGPIAEGGLASSLVAIRNRAVHAVDTRYIFLLLNSAAEVQQRDVVSSGSAQPNLSAESVAAFTFFVPRINEQREIVSHLDRETSQIDALSAKAREMIDVLKERRQALISAAVTGKIDVRGLS